VVVQVNKASGNDKARGINDAFGPRQIDLPTAAILPRDMPASAKNQELPVPSAILPLLITTSNSRERDVGEDEVCCDAIC
jgi:hypothetical protein